MIRGLSCFGQGKRTPSVLHAIFSRTLSRRFRRRSCIRHKYVSKGHAISGRKCVLRDEKSRKAKLFPQGKQALRLADRVGAAFGGRLALHKGSAGGCAFTLALFSQARESGPQAMVGPTHPLTGRVAIGGQPLPDRPSLVIRKTPVSRPYERDRKHGNAPLQIAMQSLLLSFEPPKSCPWLKRPWCEHAP